MNDIKVKDVLKIEHTSLLSGDKETVLQNFKKDTREIEKSDTYIGISGEKFNGSDFFEKAFENGAGACILENVKINQETLKKYQNKVIINTNDSIKTIQELAKYKRSLYNIPVIGITGSVGKTSTKDIIASVMSKKYKTLKTEGNYNNHIGVPLTVLKLKEHEALVVEMGMNHLGEIRVLTNIAKPTMAVITNIGTSHIGELGSRENILKAKLEIIEGMNESSPIVINNDNDMLHDWYLKNKDKRRIITYGIENKSDIMAQNIVTYDNKSTFDVNINNQIYHVTVEVGGKHFIANSLCAICVGLENNISMEKILEGIREFKLTKRRMEIVETKCGAKIINDSYNASYDSMKSAIEYLGEIKSKRKIAILGDMLELGSFEEELHRKVGMEVYKNKIDVLITVGDRAKMIADEAKIMGMKKENVFCFDNNEEAIKKIDSLIDKDDYILVKASNAMHFDNIVSGVEK